MPTADRLFAGALRQHRAGNLADAIAAYRKVLDLAPGHRPTLRQLAVALAATDAVDEAIATCRALIELAPEKPRGSVMLARLLERQGRLGEALEAYRAALRRRPDSKAAIAGLNALLLLLGRRTATRGRKVCLYTAVFGDYDEIRDPARQDVDCDYVLVTDRAAIVPAPAVWKVLTIDSSRLLAMHPRISAKYFKIMAHDFFPWLSRFAGDAGLHDYDHVVWIDASVRVVAADFVSFMLGSIDRNGLAMFRHPARDCIYREAALSLRMAKYRGQPIAEQVAHYRREGFPKRHGLMAATVFARDLRRQDVNAVFDDWWRENLTWTYQDQLSLPYLLWKHGIWYDAIEENLARNRFFEWLVSDRQPASRVT